jgi:hypothetical protein
MSVASWLHLARRFVGSLVPGGPPAPAEAWARASLTSGEAALWDRMSPADRRHAIEVARRASGALGDGATRPVIAAALLHDVGKLDAGFGPFRRAAASLVAQTIGYDRVRAWRHRPGQRGRVGRYVCHDTTGADMLAAAGSHELTVRWARDHHGTPDGWGVPRWIGDALKDADDI